MATKKATKVDKKATKVAIKSSKKNVKSIAKKPVEKVVKKSAVKVNAPTKVIAPKKETVKKTVKPGRIQTAEGWKRMMLKQQKIKKK